MRRLRCADCDAAATVRWLRRVGRGVVAAVWWRIGRWAGTSRPTAANGDPDAYFVWPSQTIVNGPQLQLVPQA